MDKNNRKNKKPSMEQASGNDGVSGLDKTEIMMLVQNADSFENLAEGAPAAGRQAGYPTTDVP